MKKLIILAVLLQSPFSFSQIATSSFFGQMKSINPGVINKRRAGFFSLGVTKDEFLKEQKFVDADVQGSVGGDATSEITIDDLKIFRGGKGGTLTSEFLFVKTTGTLVDTIEQTNGNTTTSESTADTTYANFQTGLSVFGVGVGVLNYKYSNKYSFTIDSSNYSNDFNATITALEVTGGWAGSIGSMKLGLMGRMINSNVKSKGDQAEENQDEAQTAMLVGVGIGIETSSFHTELGIEKPLVEPPEEPNMIDPPDAPLRITAVFEVKLGKITIGYTGYYITGSFPIAELIVENQLVYPSPENRLINKINVMFGKAEKGFSLSGSYSVSDIVTKEKVPFFGSSDIDTNVSSKSVSVELSYVF